MKVLVLGGSGMLGHRLWISLQSRHEVWVSVLGDQSPFPNVPEFPPQRIHLGVDAESSDQLARVLNALRPDVVVNCIGVIKQRKEAVDPSLSISLNALFPHRLASICKLVGSRMIHISTDCVFTGSKGGYRESDLSDAEDLYGRTKALGEVHYPHTVTLRTSIIGQELATRFGLIEWFLAQTGAIHGYQKAIFTGVTTIELSRVIRDYVMPNGALSGLYHVSSTPVTKYELLRMAAAAYGRPIEIEPDASVVCDRSLDSSRFRQATGYQPPAWPEMLAEMASQAPFYSQFRG